MVPAMTSAGARVDLTWCTTTQPQIIFGVRFTRNAPWAASKICVCVAKNLGNCAESLNSRQNCVGNKFPAQTELYSLGRSVTSMSELEFRQYIRINFL